MMVLLRCCIARNVPLARYSVCAAIWPVLASSTPMRIGSAARATNGAASGAAVTAALPSRTLRRGINRPVVPVTILVSPPGASFIGAARFRLAGFPYASNLDPGSVPRRLARAARATANPRRRVFVPDDPSDFHEHCLTFSLQPDVQLPGVR